MRGTATRRGGGVEAPTKILALGGVRWRINGSVRASGILGVACRGWERTLTQVLRSTSLDDDEREKR